MLAGLLLVVFSSSCWGGGPVLSNVAVSLGISGYEMKHDCSLGLHWRVERKGGRGRERERGGKEEEREREGGADQ